MDVVVAATGQHRREHPGTGIAEELPPAFAEENLVIAIALGHGIPLCSGFQDLQKSPFFNHGAANAAKTNFAILTQWDGVFEWAAVPHIIAVRCERE